VKKPVFSCCSICSPYSSEKFDEKIREILENTPISETHFFSPTLYTNSLLPEKNNCKVMEILATFHVVGEHGLF
jgi:hypothetical protein